MFPRARHGARRRGGSPRPGLGRLYAYGYGMPVLGGENVYWPCAEGTLLDLGGYNYGPDWDPWQTATRQEGAELLRNLVELLEGQR